MTDTTEEDTALLQRALDGLLSFSGNICNYVHHSKKDQHSYFAECPVDTRHHKVIEDLKKRLQ